MIKGAAFLLLLVLRLLSGVQATEASATFPVTTWTSRLRQPVYGDIADIAFGASRFVAVGARGTIIYSASSTFPVG